MKIKYARTKLPISVFLAGPTPRTGQAVQSWRPEAIGLFEEMGFKGTLFVPEDSNGSSKFNYDDQIEWELQALHSATVVLFWIPRTTDMPAYTTNIEFGMFSHRRNIVVGSPNEAEKMTYIRSICSMNKIPFKSNLRHTVRDAIVLSEKPFSQE